MNEADLKLSSEICKVGIRLYERGYVASNDGNISAKTEDGNILITPSGVSKRDLTPDMIIKTDLDGNIIAGSTASTDNIAENTEIGEKTLIGEKTAPLTPSSEIGMHLMLYRENRDIRAAVHAHPVAATSFACAGLPLDKPIYPEAVINLGTVPVTEFAKYGTPAVAQSVKPFVADYKAVLLKNHGALTWGKNLTEALYRLEALENYAKIILNVYYIIKHPAELGPEETD
jgi:L-fuculose-phosphate aldolase